MRYALCIFLGIVLSACKKAPTAELQAAFQAGPEQKAQKQLADEALEAYKKNDYPKAVVNLQTLRSDPTLNGDQLTAVQDVMARVQMDLVRQMEAGDKQAEAAYRM